VFEDAFEHTGIVDERDSRRAVQAISCMRF
jgi:hypothetical protein